MIKIKNVSAKDIFNGKYQNNKNSVKSVDLSGIDLGHFNTESKNRIFINKFLHECPNLKKISFGEFYAEQRDSVYPYAQFKNMSPYECQYDVEDSFPIPKSVTKLEIRSVKMYHQVPPMSDKLEKLSITKMEEGSSLVLPKNLKHFTFKNVGLSACLDFSKNEKLESLKINYWESEMKGTVKFSPFLVFSKPVIFLKLVWASRVLSLCRLIVISLLSIILSQLLKKSFLPVAAAFHIVMFFARCYGWMI